MTIQTLNKKIKDLWELKSFKIFLFAIVIMAIMVGCYLYYHPSSNFWSSLIAGWLAGLILMSLQIFIDYENLHQKRIIKEAALKKILADRDERAYYQSLLEQADDDVWIMGVSAARFFGDFGRSSTESRKDKPIIDKLLAKEVKFRILLTDKKSKKSLETNPYINKYKKDDNFKVRYFDKNVYIPQSIFVVDDQCILGPIFTDQDSKDTVAIHIYDKNSIYAKQYMKYFDKVWEASAPKYEQ